MMTQTHSYRPAEHQSRHEIDLAIGVLMGIRRCSEQAALQALVAATRASGVGLGGVSRTLLTVISAGVESTAVDEAVAHWHAVLGLPTHHGD
jgi:ANTAR domain